MSNDERVEKDQEVRLVIEKATAALDHATKGDSPTTWAGTPWWHVHRLLAVVQPEPARVSAEPDLDSPERDSLAEQMRRALDEDMRYDDDDWVRLADAALRWFREHSA